METRKRACLFQQLNRTLRFNSGVEMDRCCDTTGGPQTWICPGDGSAGHPVPLITLKSLLRPAVFERLDHRVNYGFCSNSDCPVVYFSKSMIWFTQADLSVPVAQKDLGEQVPLCYCFGWTRRRISEEIGVGRGTGVLNSIYDQTRAGQCRGEVNNPQGGCCLPLIRQFVHKNCWTK